MSRAAVVRYHDGTKHHFYRFAQSLGYLDWASQPNPFRSFQGTKLIPLEFGQPGIERVAYDQLFEPGAVPPRELSAASIGGLFRHALGLSAWKRYRASEWALRVNPSSGNLHPTEAYLVAGPVSGLSDTPGVYHYAPDRHCLETRAMFAGERWRASCGSRGVCLIALTSIHWREAWKYGERAFRYCQHDLGHAIAALSFSAALAGWRTALQPAWSHRAIASLVGIDRDEDYLDAEREEPACVLLIAADNSVASNWDVPPELAEAARLGAWTGRANQLSEDHVEWTFIDEVARATQDTGSRPASSHARGAPPPLAPPAPPEGSRARAGRWRAIAARSIILQRRSALAFDGRSPIDRERFEQILARVMPGPHAPWDALWWSSRIHLALFVHRVEGLDPGLYFLPRDQGALDRVDFFKAALRRDFLWEPVSERVPLVRLARGDYRRLAARLSCDQDIAADGFFSLAMLAEFDASLAEFGPSFYRQLFWESGVVGQLLYLEAEASGARATGIGCFFDDPVHEALGLSGHAFQSLYHFAIGVPVEDARLITAPGYAAEAAPRGAPAID